MNCMARTLGIIGLGNIGKKVARLAQGFGMAVQYFDIARLSEDAADALGVKFRLFNEVLRTSDIVSLHVPLIPSTQHMMGAAQFRLMKPTAYLINTCRGPVVDEPALYEALTSGTIARRRARRVRPGAAAGEQSVVHLGQRDPDAALRRADLGQSERAVPQRLRQRASAWRAATSRYG